MKTVVDAPGMSHFPTGSRGIRPTGRKVGAVFRRSKCSLGALPGGFERLSWVVIGDDYCRFLATKTNWGYVSGNSPCLRGEKP